MNHQQAISILSRPCGCSAEENNRAREFLEQERAKAEALDIILSLRPVLLSKWTDPFALNPKANCYASFSKQASEPITDEEYAILHKFFKDEMDSDAISAKVEALKARGRL